jgi:hypothetical protein
MQIHAAERADDHEDQTDDDQRDPGETDERLIAARPPRRARPAPIHQGAPDEDQDDA